MGAALPVDTGELPWMMAGSETGCDYEVTPAVRECAQPLRSYAMFVAKTPSYVHAKVARIRGDAFARAVPMLMTPLEGAEIDARALVDILTPYGTSGTLAGQGFQAVTLAACASSLCFAQSLGCNCIWVFVHCKQCVLVYEFLPSPISTPPLDAVVVRLVESGMLRWNAGTEALHISEALHEVEDQGVAQRFVSAFSQCPGFRAQDAGGGQECAGCGTPGGNAPLGDELSACGPRLPLGADFLGASIDLAGPDSDGSENSIAS